MNNDLHLTVALLAAGCPTYLVPVALDWLRQQPLTDDPVVFMRLLDDAGRVSKAANATIVTDPAA